MWWVGRGLRVDRGGGGSGVGVVGVQGYVGRGGGVQGWVGRGGGVHGVSR